MSIAYCPKCQSEDIELKCITPDEPKRVSIDNLKAEMLACDTMDGQPRMIPAVMRYKKYKATCRKCNYFVEFMA